MLANRGVDVIYNGGSIYIIDDTGKALLKFSPDSMHVFVIRALDCICQSKGREPIAREVLANLLAERIDNGKGLS